MTVYIRVFIFLWISTGLLWSSAFGQSADENAPLPRKTFSRAKCQAYCYNKVSLKKNPIYVLFPLYTCTRSYIYILLQTQYLYVYTFTKSKAEIKATRAMV